MYRVPVTTVSDLNSPVVVQRRLYTVTLNNTLGFTQSISPPKGFQWDIQELIGYGTMYTNYGDRRLVVTIYDGITGQTEWQDASKELQRNNICRISFGPTLQSFDSDGVESSDGLVQWCTRSCPEHLYGSDSLGLVLDNAFANDFMDIYIKLLEYAL